ncbi:DNA cytosine methyltransferase [Ferroacidibacillus organovorans]|uniref:DNA (cytosine-5-)-methyltransferase n=1 Tax=Ferroacidibacillus organovorans TaxID=1765683 RepID=A0A853KGV5_9BACL|nr:DNA (cytosine-5-)-methyltransferase [Ferroacidibacillus organovorans]KYP79872.1 hypothetical protein AYJ22_02955 [Ferroacidibacillus organovorans]OAG94650.1 hypothetical protein AYW79_04660 [Ferroacidibacillus organovorans]
MVLRFLDLFAGIGGIRRGLERAGMACIGSVERDKFSRKSYQALFRTEGEWTHDDIQTVLPDDIPKADLWAFGFPCQDLSVAGKRQGFGGARSSLFFTVLNLLGALPEDHRPEWLVAENVVGFLSSNRGYDFLAAQVALAESGYDCEWEVLCATSFGIPQHRERVFLIGHARNRGRRTVLPLHNGRTNPPHAVEQTTQSQESETIAQPGDQKRTIGTAADEKPTPIYAAVATPGFLNKQQRHRFKDPDEPMFTLAALSTHGVLVTRRGQGQEAKWNVRNTATCLDANYYKGLDAHQMRTGVAVQTALRLPDDTGQTGRVFDPSGISPTLLNHHGGAVTKIVQDTRIRRLTPRECWRLMGRTDTEFNTAKDAGVSDTQLYKQAGNSVIPQIVAAIGGRIIQETIRPS